MKIEIEVEVSDTIVVTDDGVGVDGGVDGVGGAASLKIISLSEVVHRAAAIT